MVTEYRLTKMAVEERDAISQAAGRPNG
jgi:hypothetical protein